MARPRDGYRLGRARLKQSHDVDAVIDEIDGRHIRVGDQWLSDFASCNYLGFDLDKRIIDAVPGYLDDWGTHPSWSRLLGSPVIYEQIEEKVTHLVGSEDTLLLPTITHIHSGDRCSSGTERSFWTGGRTRHLRRSNYGHGPRGDGAAFLPEYPEHWRQPFEPAIRRRS